MLKDPLEPKEFWKILVLKKFLSNNKILNRLLRIRSLKFGDTHKVSDDVLVM